MSSIVNDIEVEAEVAADNVLDRFEFLWNAHAESVARDWSAAVVGRFPKKSL